MPKRMGAPACGAESNLLVNSRGTTDEVGVTRTLFGRALLPLNRIALGSLCLYLEGGARSRLNNKQTN